MFRTLTVLHHAPLIFTMFPFPEKPFTAIGPIYFEYGSLVITFNTPKAATAAVQKLQNAAYEDKKLIVLCLPNVQVHMLSAEVEPLLVLINVKSGGCQGTELITAFRRLLNPFQVFDVLKGGPLVGLYVFRNIPKYRILAAGGDGTIGWVLQCLDIAKQVRSFLPATNAQLTFLLGCCVLLTPVRNSAPRDGE